MDVTTSKGVGWGVGGGGGISSLQQNSTWVVKVSSQILEGLTEMKEGGGGGGGVYQVFNRVQPG